MRGTTLLSFDAPPAMSRCSGRPARSSVSCPMRTKFEESSVVLGPGDVLALYTDGVTEAEDPSGEPFGELRLSDLLGRWRGESAQRVSSLVAAEVDRFSPGEPSDDRTLVIGHWTS